MVRLYIETHAIPKSRPILSIAAIDMQMIQVWGFPSWDQMLWKRHKKRTLENYANSFCIQRGWNQSMLSDIARRKICQWLSFEIEDWEWADDEFIKLRVILRPMCLISTYHIKHIGSTITNGIAIPHANRVDSIVGPFPSLFFCGTTIIRNTNHPSIDEIKVWKAILIWKEGGMQEKSVKLQVRVAVLEP